MFEKVELWNEPQNIFEKAPSLHLELMSDFELGFLCSLLRERAPKKIVEIGVCYGGTTAVILNALSMMGSSANMYSIDIAIDPLYVDGKQVSYGFAAEEAKKHIESNVQHKLLLGKVCAEHLEEIGTGIDFLILDTTHALPGEVLDFIACCPYLSPDAVVVAHDISAHQYHYINKPDSPWSSPYACATNVLLSNVAGKKVIAEYPYLREQYPNIGAFSVNNDTMKYIENCFLALVLPWSYMPTPEQIDAYRTIIEKYYPADLQKLFEKAVKLNEFSLKKRLARVPSIETVIEEIAPLLNGEFEHVFLCGLDYMTAKTFTYFDRNKWKYTGIIAPDYITDLPVFDFETFHISDMPYDKDKTAVLIAADTAGHDALVDALRSAGYRNIFPNPDDNSSAILCDEIANAVSDKEI